MTKSTGKISSGDELVIAYCKDANVKKLREILLDKSYILTKNVGRAFYHAIASNNVIVLNTLVVNFPLKTFLDYFLSKHYEEVILNGIEISKQMEQKVHYFLFDFRFEENFDGQATEDATKERIIMVQEIISRTIEADHSKFPFLCKLVVENISILKQSLKFSYVAIPWEEMEFLLAAYIGSRDSAIKAFPASTLTKPKMTKYLKRFASLIENFFEKDHTCDNVFPDQIREDIVDQIIAKNPLLQGFYDDYILVHDMHCLCEISNRINIALRTNMTENERKILIQKAVLVLSKYMSESFESPGLSINIRLRLYLMLPEDARDIFVDLMVSPNSFLHFKTRNVQNCLKNLKAALLDIINRKEITSTEKILEDFVNPTTSIEIINEKSSFFNYCTLEPISISRFRLAEAKNLEKIVRKVEDLLKDASVYEQSLFDEIDKSIFKFDNENVSNFPSFKANFLTLTVENQEDVRMKRFMAASLLTCFSSKIHPDVVYEVLSVLFEILESMNSRELRSQTLEHLFVELFLLSDFKDDNSWIFELKRKFLSKLELKIDQSQINVKIQTVGDCFHIAPDYVKNDVSKNLEEMEKNPKVKTFFELYISEIAKKSKFQTNYMNEFAPIWTGCYLKNGLDPYDALYLDHRFALASNTQRFLFPKKRSTKYVTPPLKEKFEFVCSILESKEKMFQAFLSGDLDSVQDCLKMADIRSKNKDGWTVLHFAAKGKEVDILKFAIKAFQVVDLKDRNGNTPLHIAAYHGRTKNVQFLIKSKAVFNIKNNLSITPLHLAALNGHEDVVKLLLKLGGDCFYDVLGQSPVCYCFREKNIDSQKHVNVAKVFLERFKDINSRIQFTGTTALHHFVSMGSLEMVEYLCYRKVDVNAVCVEKKTALHTAACVKNWNLDIIRCLIVHGANVNSPDMFGWTPLMYALKFENAEVASLLVKMGASTKGISSSLSSMIKKESNMIVRLLDNCLLDNYDFMINVAAKYNKIDILKILLAKSKSANTNALHLAASYGQYDAAEILIGANFDVNIVGPCGKTPLHLAIEYGKKSIVELLIKNNADLNVCTNEDKTPLQLAAYSGNADVINLLMNQSSISYTYKGLSPLHIAVAERHHDAAEALLQSEAFKKTSDAMAPFHFAVLNGDIEMMQILINHDAEVDQRDENDVPPLIYACGKGFTDVVEFLIAHGANVNVEYNKMTPLLAAIQNSHNYLISVLAKNGADINENRGRPLIKAITDADLTAVETLLDNHAYLNIRNEENMTPLHFAAQSPNCFIVQTLINRGAVIDARTKDRDTPLHLAVEHSYEKNVQVLLENGGKPFRKNKQQKTPLHVAATKDNLDIVKHLLSHINKVQVEDIYRKTPLDYAIMHGHSSIVELLLKHCDKPKNLLFLASEVNNVETVKILVNHGMDIHEKSSSGLKPIHIAASKGIAPVIDFYIKKGLSINETDAKNQTLLHHAVQNNCVDIIDHLISSRAKINVKDSNGLTPMCIAAEKGLTNVIEILLKNGSICRNIEKLDFKSKAIIEYTKILFRAVQNNDTNDVIACIDKGAIVDSKNQNGLTPLHVAALEGYSDVVCILIRSNANVNSTDSQLYTPLHYATRRSRIDVVKNLLYYNAVYEARCDKGYTPADYAKETELKELFRIIGELFKSVKNNNPEIIEKLKSLDVESLKAVMGAKNMNGKTATLVALDNRFSKYEELVNVGQDCPLDYLECITFSQIKALDVSLDFLWSVYETKEEILGPNNPSTLFVQAMIAQNYVFLKKYDEALEMLNEVFKKYSKLFGQNHVKILEIRAMIGNLLVEKGDVNDGFHTVMETCEIMKKVLEPSNRLLIMSQFYLATAHEKRNEKELALELNREIYKNASDFDSIKMAMENIAELVCQQGKVSEAIATIKQTYMTVKTNCGTASEETKLIFEAFISTILRNKRYEKDMEDLIFLLQEQKNIPGISIQNIYSVELLLATNYFMEGYLLRACRHYESCLQLRNGDPMDPENLGFMAAQLGLSQCKRSLELDPAAEVKSIDSSIALGQLKVVQSYIKEGFDVNDLVDGKTLLHVAVLHSKIEMVELLLDNGADPLQVSVGKGNTPLHAAVSIGNLEIAELLLKRSKNKSFQLVNAKTTEKETTALHIAAVKGHYEIALLLLKHGAVFNALNSSRNHPSDIAKANVLEFLQLVETQFRYAVLGDITKLDHLRKLEPSEFSAMTNARNLNEKTLLQVAIFFKNSNYAKILTSILREHSM